MNHHVSKLGTIRSRADPCILYRQDERKLVAAVTLQADDSFIVGSDKFLDIEEKESNSFSSKPRRRLHLKPTNFNGFSTSLQSDKIIRITQKKKITKLNIPRTEEGFKSQRGLAQYIGVKCRPNVCAAVQLIAPGREAIDEAQLTSLREAIRHLKNTSEVGLDFVRLDVK